MKTFTACIVVFLLSLAVAQGSTTDELSRRSSSCLRLMIVSNRCNNHGYCSLGNNGWACRCDDGWGGRDCVRELKPIAQRRQLTDGGQVVSREERKEKILELLKKVMKNI